MQGDVKAMNDSAEDNTWSDKNVLIYQPGRPAEDDFRISLAGVKHCFHECLAHSTPDASASVFKYVVENFRAVFDNARNTTFSTNIILTVVRTGYV